MINIFYINNRGKSIANFKILENSDKYHNIRKCLSNKAADKMAALSKIENLRLSFYRSIGIG